MPPRIAQETREAVDLVKSGWGIAAAAAEKGIAISTILRSKLYLAWLEETGKTASKAEPPDPA